MDVALNVGCRMRVPGGRKVRVVHRLGQHDRPNNAERAGHDGGIPPVRCHRGNDDRMNTSFLRWLPLAATLTFTINARAQQPTDQAMRTLFGSDHDVHNGGWGAPTASYTRVLDQDAMLVGVRGGWIIDHRFTLGIAGHGLVTPVNNTSYDSYLVEKGRDLYDKSRFQMGYGGLLIEPIIAYRSPVHVSLPVLIGAGGCGYQTFTDLPDEWDPANWEDDVQAFFVVEPGIDLEVNMVKLVRLGLGVSYRYTSDVLLPATSKDALNGFNATFAVKVGVF